MQISEKAQNLGLNYRVVLTALQGSFQQLFSQRIQADLLSEPPTELGIAHNDSFSLEISHQ